MYKKNVDYIDQNIFKIKNNILKLTDILNSFYPLNMIFRFRMLTLTIELLKKKIVPTTDDNFII